MVAYLHGKTLGRAKEGDEDDSRNGFQNEEHEALLTLNLEVEGRRLDAGRFIPQAWSSSDLEFIHDA